MVMIMMMMMFIAEHGASHRGVQMMNIKRTAVKISASTARLHPAHLLYIEMTTTLVGEY